MHRVPEPKKHVCAKKHVHIITCKCFITRMHFITHTSHF